jgi:hypothetical protein
VSAIFLIKISKGKIRTANPPLSANAQRFDLFSRYLQNQKIVYAV